jgi:L-ascorbate metabolism protein UlaG (beta-lactamase superfamily)
MHPFASLAVPAGSVGIHWFEQNAFAFKNSRGAIALVDPYFPTERPPERFIRPTPPVVEAELPLKYVLLTHRHSDHTNPETIRRIHAAWPKVLYLGPVEAIDQIVAEAGVDPVYTRVLAAGDVVVLDDLTVYAFYSKPPGGDPQAGIKPPDVTHLGLVIEIEGHRLYITGDAINTLAQHDEMLAPIAALKPEVGLITTHPTEGEFPFFDGTVLLARKLALKTVVPSHYQCFVKRNYDPQVLADMLPQGGAKPLIIPWNSHVVYP